MKTYDIVILGGGPGGYVAAIRAAQLGASVALIEDDTVGGVCLNWGCIPTKTLLKNAKVYENVLKAATFGVDIPQLDQVSINWPAMQQRKAKVVKTLTDGVATLLKKNKVEVYSGFGEALDDHTISVNGEEIQGKHIIVAIGSTATIPDIPGLEQSLDDKIAITAKGALNLEELPESIIVLGGGVISIEFACLFASLGKKVTLLQRSDKILKTLEPDIIKIMTSSLKKKGVSIHYGVSLESIEGNTVHTKIKGKDESFTADKILVSLGRKAKSKGIEKLELATEKGNIKTDDRLRTNKPHIYAIGDVNGKFQLAHVASAEGIVAVENIMGKDKTMNYDFIPSCIYAFPEIGVAGLTESEAIAKGHEVVSSKFPLVANGKALAEGETAGFIKIVADKKYGEILGVHIVGIHATDMIAEAVTTMQLEGTVHDLAKAVHPHPTLSEIVMEAAHGIADKPIHIFEK